MSGKLCYKRYVRLQFITNDTDVNHFYLLQANNNDEALLDIMLLNK